MSESNAPQPDSTPTPDEEEARGIGTDLAIGLGPTVAVVASHLLNRPKADEPKDEPEK